MPIPWYVLIVSIIAIFFVGLSIGYLIFSNIHVPVPVPLAADVHFDSTNYTINRPGQIIINQSSANLDPSSKDQVFVYIKSDSGSGFITPVPETGNDTGIFAKSIIFSSDNTNSSDNILHVEAGNKIHAIYGAIDSSALISPDTGMGVLATSTAPIIINPFVIYDQKPGNVIIFDASGTTPSASINSTADTTPISLTFTPTGPAGSHLFTSNPITFSSSVQASDPSNPSNIIIKIPNTGLPNVHGVKAWTSTNFVYSQVSTPPFPQVSMNPDTTLRMNCNIGDDSDNDALCNSWEQAGVGLVISNGAGVTYSVPCTHSTYDSVTDPLNANLCPDPNKPDVYVQVSWMDGHPPDTVALGKVVASFENAPVSINLHIQLDPFLMPLTESIPFDSTNPAAPSFTHLKLQYFGEASEKTASCGPNPSDVCVNAMLTLKRQAFHYAEYIHELSDTPGSSGYGEIGGNDFVVAMGDFKDQVGTTNQQSGTFMHELGHNLNLNHGGVYTASFNCKPQYPSVMNYLYQFNAASGGFLAARPLDYSHTNFALNEKNLIDSIGIPGADGLTFAFRGIIPPQDPPTGIVQSLVTPTVATGGAVDFNRNGVTTETSAYQQNLHYFGIPDCTDSALRNMAGNDDWHSLNFHFRDSSFFANGIYNLPSAEHEITASTVDEIFGITGVTTTDPASPISLAPFIQFVANETQTGNTFNGTGVIHDPFSTLFTGTVNYGDGGTIQYINGSSHSFPLSHTYTISGLYTINATITNDRGGTSSKIATLNFTSSISNSTTFYYYHVMAP